MIFYFEVILIKLNKELPYVDSIYIMLDNDKFYESPYLILLINIIGKNFNIK